MIVVVVYTPPIQANSSSSEVAMLIMSECLQDFMQGPLASSSQRGTLTPLLFASRPVCTHQAGYNSFPRFARTLSGGDALAQ